MLIGKRISGRYKLLEMIGGGGMSNVYLGHDMILDRDVAIKVLRYDFSNEEELRRRFQREALSATSLTHPNIVNIYDVGEDEDIHYIVMEHVKGETLKEYIQHNAPVSPVKTITIMKQLTSAISNAHNNHIIHRDIKPQNILLDEQENVKITDFGIAMALSATSYTQTNSVLGTVHYLSPEQARGGTATRESDIYALGIVLFELLTGQLPFSGESAVSIALKHLQAETPSVRAINPVIPQSLENVVLKATAKDPRNRYRSAEEMERDLSTAMSPERSNEPKFVVPVDDGATKVLPVIKEPVSFEDVAETKKLQTEDKPTEQPKPKKKRIKWKIMTGIIAGLILLALIIIIAFPGLFKPDKIEVPPVAGLEVEDAIKLLESEGFIIGEQILEFDDEIEKDHVIGTTPEEGKMRDVETEVDIIVSQGKETSVMGDYENQDITQVIALLEKQGFKIEEDKIYSSATAGTILKQEPEAGQEIIPEETVVRFQVSIGPEMITLRDLREYNEKNLNEYATNAGLKVVKTKEVNHDTIPKGAVVEQSPGPNSKIAKGSTVKVVVSSGPKARPTKTFVRIVPIPYLEQEPDGEGEEGEDEGNPEQEVIPQIIQIYIQDKMHKFTDPPVEEFEITSSVDKKISLEIVEGEVGGYLIKRNQEVLEQKTIKYEDID
ncbi:Stk1 family PASTA domain-containing Ser/Thr kinase [Psychrobacillus sp. FSL W7-1493]|uniref:Stk1 family PASTA domain-containing Ser/Thr kinase n=1 Tax=Psychrobacillus sp. FSL W7-1493 TaxID=2921552 RepID=UPI0030FAA21F